MTFHLGQCPVRVHGMLPCTMVLYTVVGRGWDALCMVLALALHECGHLLAAKALHIRVEMMECSPLGAVLHMDISRLSPTRRCALALAGPLFSALGLLSALALRVSPLPMPFLRATLLLCALNLLPVLPLDGGAALHALLWRLPQRRVTVALSTLGAVIGTLSVAVGLHAAFRGMVMLMPFLLGSYLWLGAAVARRDAGMHYISALIGRRVRLEKGAPLPVQALVFAHDTFVSKLPAHLGTGRYHMIYVLDSDGMTLLGTLDERALCHALLSRRGDTLGEVIAGSARPFEHA